MTINDIAGREYDLLKEVVDDCALTHKSTDKAIDIYCTRALQYKMLKGYPALYNLNGCSEIDYAMSFVRDYIWFGDENNGI